MANKSQRSLSKVMRLAIVVGVLSTGSVVHADIINTVAGNGIFGFGGDGGQATQAMISNPKGLAVDGSGNLYIADEANNRIRKVDTEGIITTIAGDGGFGYSGDGVPATTTSLRAPEGVAVDSQGNVYIADAGNQMIRRVDAATGIITRVAGTGNFGFFGDGGAATEARIYYPEGLTVDSQGNLYIADSGNGRVRKVDAVTGIITTVAGGGNPPDGLGDGGPATLANLNRPVAVTIDNAGNIYIAEYFRYRVRKVDAATGIITTFAGGGTPPDGLGDGGPATQAAFVYPYGIGIDPDGNVFIADDGYYGGVSRVRKVNVATGIITTFAGGGTPPDGLGDGGPAKDARLQGATDVAFDTLGNCYIADGRNYRIRFVRRPPQANFTVAPDRGYRDLTAAFTNTTWPTEGAIYTWNFGDGEATNEPSPFHTYLAEGIYTVSLTASGPSGLPDDATTASKPDVICAGYIFSSDPATATTAPFTRVYVLGTTLYGRVWALQSDVDIASVRSATLMVTDIRGKRVSATMTDEGNGRFSASVHLNKGKLSPGAGIASFAISDSNGNVFTAAENVILE